MTLGKEMEVEGSADDCKTVERGRMHCAEDESESESESCGGCRGYGVVEKALKARKDLLAKTRRSLMRRSDRSGRRLHCLQLTLAPSARWSDTVGPDVLQ